MILEVGEHRVHIGSNYHGVSIVQQKLHRPGPKPSKEEWAKTQEGRAYPDEYPEHWSTDPRWVPDIEIVIGDPDATEAIGRALVARAKQMRATGLAEAVRRVKKGR